MPNQAEGLVWRHVPVEGGAEVYVIKEARLTELLCDAGASLRRVVIDGLDCPPLIDARATTDAPERFWNRAAPLAVLALLDLSAAFDCRPCFAATASENFMVSAALF